MFEIFELIQTNNPYVFLAYGLLVGLMHAFEPDHISAMSTQLIKKSNLSKRGNFKKISIITSLRGMFWGMGHTSSIMLVGLLIAGFSLSISSIFFLSAELIVGIMLLLLGVSVVLNKNSFKTSHIHPHRHRNAIHSHVHTHDKNHKHNHKSYLIGCVHGLAGSGVVLALSASALNNFESIMFFLALFGVGSIVGMSAIGGLLGIPFILISNVTKLANYLRYVTSISALVLGTVIIFNIVPNLFKVGLHS